MTTCDFCNKPALKTNGNSEYVCENRALSGRCEGFEPLKRDKNALNNNQKCHCGSNIKYKKCCKFKDNMINFGLL